jgi:hypothetical protein
VQRLKPKEKDLVERIRAQVKDQKLEEILRRLARDNKDEIGEDELLLGLSRLNANLYLGDLKQLTAILQGSNQKISIAETLQLIGQ